MLRIFSGHVVFVILNAFLFANTPWVIPMVALKTYDASAWQSALITASFSAFLMTSILWNEALRRLGVRTYLLVYWLSAAAPLGFVGLSGGFGSLLLLHVVASAGIAGWTPVYGVLLKRFYPDAVRGRTFALLTAAQQGAAIVTGLLIASWLSSFGDAFRIYLPAAAIVQLAGILLLRRLARSADRDETEAAAVANAPAPVNPFRGMFQTLREDRLFLRFEAAFMTYGAAFMFVAALLPILAEFKLGMTIDEFGRSTAVTQRAAMLLMVYPMGWLNDRLGSTRTCGLAFLVLAANPVILAMTNDLTGVRLASVVMGLAMAGVSMGWTLGPVTLARDARKVAHYTAVHATLVGVRAVIFQPLGVWLYRLSDGFALPLTFAALCFAGAGLQMLALPRVGATSESEPGEPARTAAEPSETNRVYRRSA